MANQLVVFVHGWSVYETKTYGKLPERVALEASDRGFEVDIEHVFLGKYVSFRDEVRLEDISRAFEYALRTETAIVDALANNTRIAVITHSTGGPVVRDWWWRFYASENKPCPMSHLIMLAPANFGSALAQLGKGTLNRIMSRLDQVEPGAGVLDWLELGSDESWALDEAWIKSSPPWNGTNPVFPFVLTGQSIDRKLYDQVNSYTDEMGSDGVVRVPSANLNATYVKLEQHWNAGAESAPGNSPELDVTEQFTAPVTAFAILPGRSHSGRDMGIIASVKKTGKHPTVDAVLDCLAVKDAAAYTRVCDQFTAQTTAVIEAERLESTKELFIFTRHFIHDQTTMLVVRLNDDQAHPLTDFDFLLTACDPDNADEELRVPNPNLLPPGFFVDRQRNSRDKSTLTFLLDYDVMTGIGPLTDEDGKDVRPAQPGAKALGIRIVARPQPDPDDKKNKLLVHYVTAELEAKALTLREFVKPNQTLMLDISLKRVVREGVFRLTRGKQDQDFKNEDFRGQPPGDPID